jgi:hypothetical protein
MKLTAQGRMAALSMSSLNQDTLILLRNLPGGKKKWRGSTLLFEPTEAALQYVKNTFPKAEWDVGAKKFLATIELIHKSIIQIPPTVPRDFLYKTKPWDHQDREFLKSRDLFAYALFWEQGTGKTKTALDTAAYLWSKGKIRGLLVIAYPNGVHENWTRKEVPEHLPDWCERIAVAWDSTKGEKPLEVLYQANLDGDSRLRILTINVEALSTKRGEEVCRRFLMAFPSLVVVDESSSIKKISAQRSKAIIRLGGYAPYRRIMTGTAGGPLNLFSQFLYLDEDILGFSSYYSYRARYAVLRALPTKTDHGGRPIQIVVNYQHTDELRAKIAPHSSRILKKDCLDLPPKVYLPPLEVKLTPQQKALYNQFTEELMAEFNGRIITAELAITRMLRHHQVVCGFMPPANVDDMGEPIEGGNPRLDVLMKYVDTCIPWDDELKRFDAELDTKMIVWANYRYNIREITQAMTEKYGAGVAIPFSGNTPSKLRYSLVERFQDPHSKVKFFVGNKALAYGWTLTLGRYNAYYSNNFDLEVRLQSEDRTHRGGQDQSVSYMDLIARRTIDETIIKRLTTNFRLAGEVMGDEEREWLKRPVSKAEVKGWLTGGLAE